MSEVNVESPCISVCAMDDNSGLCLGCYRTLNEIQGWWDFDNTVKQRIVDAASERQQAVFD